MSLRFWIVVLASCALLQVTVAGPVIDWLKNNKDTTTLAGALETLVSRGVSPKAKFTLFAPTNQAIEAFLRDMRLTPAQFRDRKGLLDLVVSYHVVPGHQAKELKLEKSPSVAVTGDINYMVRLHNTAKGVTLEDVQGNNVTLSKPVVLNDASIIVVDRVLMSGGYFFSGKQALSHYPEWSEARKFANAVGYPDGTVQNQDMTLFVPDNKAMTAAQSTINKLSKDQQKNVFLYHITEPARSVPSDFKNGKMFTNFKGHDIMVDIKTDSSKKDEFTGKPNVVPSLTLTSETGNKAQVKIFNIFVGQSLWQGIDSVLVPKLGGDSSKVSTEAGNKNRRMLLSWALDAVTAVTGHRSLLWGGGRGGGGYESYGVRQQYANTIAQDNTAQAIEAAATGSIPTNYATRYGSYQANVAAQGCLNCRGW